MIEDYDESKQPQKPITFYVYVNKTGDVVYRLSVDVNKKKIRIEDEDNILILDKEASYSLAAKLLAAHKMLDKL